MTRAITEGRTPVRLSQDEKRQILLAVQSLESRIPGFRWREIALFGSRTQADARDGDIDLYLRIDRVAGIPASHVKRELRIALEDSLGEQKFDLVLDDGGQDLEAFGEIIMRQKVELWRQN